MNDFIIAGLFMLGISVITITSTIAIFTILDKYDRNNDGLGLLYIWFIFTIIMSLFIMGGVPFLLPLWLIMYGIMIFLYIYIKIKEYNENKRKNR